MVILPFPRTETLGVHSDWSRLGYRVRICLVLGGKFQVQL